jgi:hypothetical protein
MNVRGASCRTALATWLAIGASACRQTRSESLMAPGPALDAATKTTDVALQPPDDATPPSENEELASRARHLLEAIAADDPRLASDLLFPRDGWIATRDTSDPGQEWDKHVATPFRRAVHKLSRRRAQFDAAEFISLEVGAAMQQQTPRRRAWKKPLWTVRGSRVTFIVEGRTRTLTIREMTAWRGHWYVTRLR